MTTIIENNKLVLESFDNKVLVTNLTNGKERMILGFEIPKSYNDWMILVYFCGTTFFD